MKLTGVVHLVVGRNVVLDQNGDTVQWPVKRLATVTILTAQ